MSKPPVDNIKKQIMERIQAKEVCMRPKWHFVLKSILGVLGLSAAVLFLLYIVSLIVFTLEYTGVLFAPSFGWKGVFLFLISIPWMLIIVSLFLLLVVEALVQHYAFAYKQPVVYSVVTIIAVVTVGSVGVAKTGLHEKVVAHVQEASMNIPGTIYKAAPPRYKDGELIQMGKISEVIADGFVLEGRRGEKIVVVLTGDTRFPRGIDFREGEFVVVVGTKKGITTTAFGIRSIADARPHKRPVHETPLQDMFEMRKAQISPAIAQ